MARRDPSVDRALRILDEVARTPIETGPVRLSDEYLRAVKRVEALPESRNGTDKTWVETADREFREHYARAKLVR